MENKFAIPYKASPQAEQIAISRHISVPTFCEGAAHKREKPQQISRKLNGWGYMGFRSKKSGYGE